MKYYTAFGIAVLCLLFGVSLGRTLESRMPRRSDHDLLALAQRANAAAQKSMDQTSSAISEAKAAQEWAFKYKALYEEAYENLRQCYHARQAEDGRQR